MHKLRDMNVRFIKLPRADNIYRKSRPRIKLLNQNPKKSQKAKNSILSNEDNISLITDPLRM